MKLKKAIVTGCAGFIGSSLSKRLLKDGYEVIGVDCFTRNYDKSMKEKNMRSLMTNSKFTFLAKNIIDVDWSQLLANTSYIFHQAAMPGVRTSWGSTFDSYVRHNILATQVLLEAAKNNPVEKFVYASSSSIYGVTTGSTSETQTPRPHSPYGVTKLSGEQLCHLYSDNYGVPTISLRYFTVYGPGQRPDMAFHKFIRALLKGQELPIYGNGMQTRDFTYVDDIVEANLLAAISPVQGEAFNIGGKSRVVLRDVIEQMGKLMGITPKLQRLPTQAGDPPHTWANIDKAKEQLGYEPQIPLEEGLREEIQYIKELYP